MTNRSSNYRLFTHSALVLGLLAFVEAAADAQHQGHATAGVTADTSATAPVAPSRPTIDSALVADSLLRVCRSHRSHSVDAYSTCIGDGLASLSAAGNIALAMGTLDVVIHRDTSL